MEAIILVDIQNDFCPGGSLGVQSGDQIIPIINQLTKRFEIVIQTQDWHPPNHSSFASNHKDKQEYKTIELSYGTQVLWPDHCVQGTFGAEFHKDLNTHPTQLIIRKGMDPKIDSYSAFFENDRKTSTGLTGFLKSRNVQNLYICGLATDFCVKWSAIDGIKEGFDVSVIRDASRGIDLNNSVEKAWEEMESMGVKSVLSNNLLV